MNLLFIYEVDYLRKVVYDMHILAEGMSLRGHSVYAIDHEDMRQQNEESPKEVVVSRVFPEAKLHLTHPYFIKMPVLNRLSAFVAHFFEIRRVIKEKRIDAIVLYSVPTNGLQTVYWAKKYGIPVIFRSLDVLNQLVTTSMLRPVTRYFEKKVYSQVEMVATLTPKLSEYVYGLGAKKAEVLPMTVDTDSFCHFKSDIGEKWGLTEDDSVILFMGTLFKFSGLDSFIANFRHILRKIPNAKLLVVGDGEQRRDLEWLASEYDITDKVIITGFQPYEEMPSYINLADVCILPFENNKVTRDIFPGKVVQYLACAKPVVAMGLPGMQSVIQGEEQGVVYVQSAGEMVDSVTSLLKSVEQRWILGSYGWNYTRRIHSCDKVAEKLEGMIGRVR